MRTHHKADGLFGRLAKAYDKFVAIRDPQRALKNAHLREAALRMSYRNANRNRIRPYSYGLGGSGDRHLGSQELWQLRELSRELDRDNVIASSMLDRATESIIGQGIDLQLQSGSKVWDRRAEQMFHRWWDTEADVRGQQLGWQMEQLAYRSSKVDGDCAFIKTGDGQIQPIEADYITTPNDLSRDNLNQSGSSFIVNGIELDKYGKPMAFWVCNEVLQSSGVAQKFSGRSKTKAEYTRVPAENVVFLANYKRFSQTRGVPVFSTNMQLFDDIDAFIETCIIHAKIAASHVLFIERNGGLSDLDGVETTEDAAGNDRQEQIQSPGQILYGERGETAKGIGSTQSMVQFSQFVTQLLRFTGLNFGMPLEMLSLDFSRTNYSSARAALLVAHKSFVGQHKVMVKRFLEPIARWKIEEWTNRGLLGMRPNGYRVSATPPRLISVDPGKEASADVTRVQHGHSTNRNVCAALGEDWEDVLTQRSIEIGAASKLAAKLSAPGMEKVSWRDLLGDAKNFDAKMYLDQDDPDAPEPTAPGGDDE